MEAQKPKSDIRRTDIVHRIVNELLDSPEHADGFRPGDVNARLRELETPMGTWEVRGELANLEAAGVIVLNTDTAVWTRPKPTPASEPLRHTG